VTEEKDAIPFVSRKAAKGRKVLFAYSLPINFLGESAALITLATKDGEYQTNQKQRKKM